MWYTCTKFSGDFRYGGGGKDENRKRGTGRFKEGLEKLTHFIRVMEGVKLPDFYRYFDAMKNNINIFFMRDVKILKISSRYWKGIGRHRIQCLSVYRIMI